VRVALLEDDPDQGRLVAHWLESAGHRCELHTRSDVFLRVALRESFDLLVLDWMLPGLSGVDVMQRVRQSGKDYTPVLMVTARDEEADVVAALRAGADDYMVKPLRRAEFLARAGALVRTVRGGRPELELPDTSPYEIDLERKRISLRGEAVPLTNREYDLAVFMFRNAGRALSRAHLLEAIWGMPNMEMNTRTVDTHMSRLRRKLELGDSGEWRLMAIYQHGYRLERAEPAPAGATSAP
jgi:two-component system response regulator RegX3